MLPTLRLIWATIAGQRLRYLCAIAALVAASCFLYLAPLLPQAVLDGVLAPSAAPGASTLWIVAALGGREYLAANLWLPALVFCGLSVLAGSFTYLRTRWAADASESIVRRVRDTIFDHMQRLPCATLDSLETGDLVQRCTSDVETLRKFLSSQVVEIGRAVVMLLIPIPLMLWIDVRMTAISLVLVPLIAAFSFFYFRKIKTRFTATDEAEGRMTTRIQENLTGIRVVRAFARQEHEAALFAARNADHRGHDYELYRLLARFWACSDMLCFVQKCLVVGVGLAFVAGGSLPVGAFFYFLSVVTLFIFPVRHMGRILADLGKAVVALGRLDDVLKKATEADADAALEAEADDESITLSGDVRFEQVSFRHGEVDVLKDVSFELPAGQTLGILGASGSGKSTIVNLLVRLYDDEQGSIQLGGVELRDLPRATVRRHVAVALQEPFLFSRTLRGNLRLGRLGASDEEVEEAARCADIHETVLSFEEGYATKVGERGVTLSGGQRQRMALARALLQRPALLILDDALSAVDTATEAKILEGLRAARARQSTIVIAHRVSTVMDADQILILDQGRVVQRGAHAELVAVPGPYRRLYRAQTGAEPEEDPEADTSESPLARTGDSRTQTERPDRDEPRAAKAVALPTSPAASQLAPAFAQAN